jgi:hypothetical protein
MIGNRMRHISVPRPIEGPRRCPRDSGFLERSASKIQIRLRARLNIAQPISSLDQRKQNVHASGESVCSVPHLQALFIACDMSR